MIGWIILGLVALAHKNQGTSNTRVSVGIPSSLVKPSLLTNTQARDAHTAQTQTWQNWQQTTGTPVSPGAAQDIYAQGTAQADTKTLQEEGLKVINPVSGGTLITSTTRASGATGPAPPPPLGSGFTGGSGGIGGSH